MDEEAFLDWLDEQPGRIPLSRVEDEWPGFFEDGYSEKLVGVTVTLGEDGESLYPTRDLRDVVRRCVPMD